MQRSFGLAGLVLATLALTACGGEKQEQATEADRAAPTAAATNEAPAPTGDTIVVEMITDDSGNYFKPREIEARKGDLIRFTLAAGVHNVHFLPDSNPGKSGLPPASELLQLPGQTVDIVVTMEPGHYYFQCDPHALLGMVGKLEVED